jgi:hypothetical protein
METMIEALREFDMRDEEGRSLCTEVLATAIRAAFYRVFGAAEMLLIHTGEYVPREFWSPYLVQEEAVSNMKRVYPEAVHEGCQPLWLHKLCVLATRIEELKPHWRD